MAFAGMSVAQNVWSSGYFTNSDGFKSAGVYKNGSLRSSVNGTATILHESSSVDVYNGNVYWVDNALNSDGTYRYGDIFSCTVDNFNSTRYLSTSGGSHIFRLYRASNTGNLFAVGCKTIDDVQKAVVWKNNENTPLFTLGTGSYPSAAYGATHLDDYVYECGCQYTNSSTYHGVIWKAANVFYAFENGTKIYDMAYFGGYFFSVGSAVESGATKLKVWKTNASTGSTTVLYVISTSMANNYVNERFGIHIDAAGDIYVNGMESSVDKIWKNGEVLYSSADMAYGCAVMANTDGVYYCGGTGNSSGKIWKDGAVLYSPTNCARITDLFVEEPECPSIQVRSLPFNETFENGSTSWPCWTTMDMDISNGTNASYWHRGGRYLCSIEGNYCARHAGNPSSSQDGWLITPRLFLQPFQSMTKMTFKSWVNENFTLKVYVSTNGDPTITSSFTEVYSQIQSQGHQTHTVDLSAYQGHAVYIAFRYIGLLSTSWLIDNVSVTEGFTPCDPTEVPYSLTFSTLDAFRCWTAYDVDMAPQTSGYAGTWQYSTTEGYDGTPCMYHHYGPNGISQTGWFFSRRFTLPSGNFIYTMTFKSRTKETGSGKKNTIWLAQNESGAPEVSHFTTKIWEDHNYSSNWTTYTIDLTPYKGKTITLGFKYEGTYAHNWYIDDFAITKENAEYIITANPNNNDWGTVTGGGTYNAGATCTLTATPESGYQFQSWKKNGSVVSTSPTYAFTVNENASYTGVFGEVVINYYNIFTEANPTDGGTVTGYGNYQEGSSITLEAIPNPGYTFKQWHDGNQENPRTITVTQEATYIAYFDQEEYEIKVYANPAEGGYVYGEGTYHYGETVTLSAEPNPDFEFGGWQDGITDNPRDIIVTGDANYTAMFNVVGTTVYMVTTHVDPENAGTVTGGGVFEEGTTITLKAEANEGYLFVQWNDGNTQNPRVITVTSDIDITAQFKHLQYYITVEADPVEGGSVSGSGYFYYGETATLKAMAFSGYEFVGWSDGSMENPHLVTVTGNATYTATFSKVGHTYYTVSTNVSPAEAGMVTGAGPYEAGSIATLTAEASEGYTFLKWNDGSAENPRTVTVNNNMSFTAFFVPKQYTITVRANPLEGGRVSGDGTFNYGAITTLLAKPNQNYTFVQWRDGSLDNPRTVTVTEDATYVAMFKKQGTQEYTLTVVSEDSSLGSVMGGGTYPAGAEVQISAYPAANAYFVKWDDNNTENPRTVVVNSDMKFVASFAKAKTYDIVVESADPSMGTTTGTGTYNMGAQVEIVASAYDGYRFKQWNDGNTQSIRTITVTGDATYKAYFEASGVVTHTVTLYCNTDEGSVVGGGTYAEGSTATILAMPKTGYRFIKWSDENTQNPRQLTVNEDVMLIAFFALGVDDNELNTLSIYPNPATESIRIEGLETSCEVEIYNSLGELVKVTSVSAGQEIGVRELASGLYLVRCGNTMLRFVKQQ